MSELRLVPAAAAVWAVTLTVILAGPIAGAGLIAVAALVLLFLREPGQATLVSGVGVCALALTWERVTRAESTVFGRSIVGTVSGSPRELASGTWLVRLQVPEYPAMVPVFADALPAGTAAGALVEATGRVAEASRPGIGAVAVSGQLEVLGPPQGFAAFALGVRERFAAVVVEVVGERAQGLIPGMVLGDTTLQSQEEQQAYVETGLSHLSAVSGANCMYVATAAMLIARAVRLGLRGQLAAAGAALLLYAAMIGPEPSVLRASVSGLVGLVAVVSSTRAEPLHALCLSVIGLVLVDSDLAADYAFALSVAATAAIVAVSPLFYRALAPTGWPDILVRALSVAIAADLATAPIIAGMVGEVSLVAVAANVFVGPVTGIVTVLGLAAAVLAQISPFLAVPVLWLVEPLAAWVRVVAEVGARLPGATVTAAPLTVVVMYGWVAAGFIAGRPRLTLACAGAGILVVTAAGGGWGSAVDPGALRAHVVNAEAEIDPVPPGTQLVVVLDPAGKPHTRPVVTRDGVPVIYPARDGPVDIRRDGTQRARSGNF